MWVCDAVQSLFPLSKTGKSMKSAFSVLCPESLFSQTSITQEPLLKSQYVSPGLTANFQDSADPPVGRGPPQPSAWQGFWSHLPGEVGAWLPLGPEQALGTLACAPKQPVAPVSMGGFGKELGDSDPVPLSSKEIQPSLTSHSLPEAPAPRSSCRTFGDWSSPPCLQP